MWSMLYCTKPFSGLPSHPNSADNISISAITAMHINKVLKSLQILCFCWRSLYTALVILAFISHIEIVHFFCAKKLKPILEYNLKLVWTNRLRLNSIAVITVWPIWTCGRYGCGWYGYRMWPIWSSVWPMSVADRSSSPLSMGIPN